MGLKDSLAHMVTDFVQLRRNPEFQSKTELDEQSHKTKLTTANRRHSLQITCGTQDPAPDSCVHQRTYSLRTRVQPDDTLSLRLQNQGSLPPGRRHRRGSEPAITRPRCAVNNSEDNSTADEKKRIPVSFLPSSNSTDLNFPQPGINSSMTVTTLTNVAELSGNMPAAKTIRSPSDTPISLALPRISKSGTFSRFLLAQRSFEEPLFEEEEQLQQQEEVKERKQQHTTVIRL